MARILVVDDSSVLHRLLKMRLENARHEVVAFGKDGNEALALYALHSPDLVLMDITMPNCDGREGLAKIRSEHPEAKVLMLSALSDPKVAQECLAAGAIGFVSKDRLNEPGYLESQIHSFFVLGKSA